MLKFGALILFLPMIALAQPKSLESAAQPHAKPLNYRKTATGFVLVLKPGEKIIASLKALQEKEKIQAASISGLGSVQNVEMSFFDRKKKEYMKKTFPDFAEMVSLNGSLSWNQGQPWPHCHIAIGDANYGVKAGHMEEAETALTAEIFITTDSRKLNRVRNEELGAAFIEL